MLESARGLRVIYLAVIVLCIVASMTGARSQDKNAGSLRIANVDEDRLQNEYTPIIEFQKELAAKQQELQVQLQTWQQNQLLSQADQANLSDLAIKAGAPNGLTAAEKATQQKLLDQSRKLNDDYQRLQGTPVGNILPQDSQQLKTYYELATATGARAQQAKDNQTTIFQNKLKDTAATAQKNMKDALDKVAKEKGFTVIFSTAVAPYAEYDCTDEVLKIMNKK